MDTISDQIIKWGNPAIVNPSSTIPVRENWLLHRLDSALLVVCAYLAFVSCALFFGFDSKTEKLKADAKARAAKKRRTLTLAQKFAKGPKVFFCMVVYNTVQVLLCGYMVVTAFTASRSRGFGLVCNEHLLELPSGARGVAHVLHIFYLSKVLDFADTMFMVAKGNWRQVSFLHVYHHSSIFLIYWLIVNAAYDGDIFVTVILNGFIHFVMYGYYLATTLNVKVPLALKKLVTNLQLIQFCCMIVQAIIMLLNDCPYPRNITIMYLFYIISMFVLFNNFKRKTYSSRAKRRSAGTRIDGDDDPVTS